MKKKYDANKTMQLLGKQYHSTIIDAKIYAEIKDVMHAHDLDDTLINAFDLSMMGPDIFMLGYIYGKRAERAKKKDISLDANNSIKNNLHILIDKASDFKAKVILSFAKKYLEA